MAQAAVLQTNYEYPSTETIACFQILFNYSRVEAANLIIAQRVDVTRDHITDEHWELIKEQEAVGTTAKPTNKVFNSKSWLNGMLDTVEKVWEVAGLDKVPEQSRL
ncbi:hypothetical protein CC78DRAFT_584165 [Lojkania enalia]|uniref:Uncharacterized protein n=1 Tax=Lojkania enalia TaxID=147567 RepID=A0A9P4N6R7_9PLEO|nr:hypothetical protein CC78DRAFT_584165 [Didymosphaeria enalia]